MAAAVLAALVAGPAAAASAAPPANDAATAPAPFEVVTAANGTPRDLQAIAELAEARPDAGVPRCLGRASFARTAWFYVAPAEAAQQVTVEATGRTLEVVDLAAFVQPEGATAPATATPNACSGAGSGGADASEEPNSGVELRVPARRAVLIQVGRRGPVGPPDDERVLLSLDTRPLSPGLVGPPGDVADTSTPSASLRRGLRVRLADSAITEEDPALGPCPSLGTVWRRLVPSRSGEPLVRVAGSAASTLAVFAGRRPAAAGALDCVVRSGYGELQMRVPMKRRRPLWIRIGSDRPPSGATVTLRLKEAENVVVVDGGPGGFDPTTGGPGGGLPGSCDRARIGRARIGGPRIAGTAAARNRRSELPLAVRVRGSAICDVTLDLVGPKGRVYARRRAVRLSGGRVVRLARTRHLVKGAYRLRVTAASERGGYAEVRTSVRGRLR